MNTKLKGTYAVFPTPFNQDDTLNLSGLKENLDWMISEGVHGLIAVGSTGEFLSLTHDERKQVVETTIEHVNGRVPVIIGTADEWTKNAIYWTQHAESMGCDGVMIVAPYYSTPHEEELYAHYKSISDASNIPIMVYNNPNTTGVNMSPEFLAKLSNIERVDYLKDTTVDATRIRDIIRFSEGRLTVFAGLLPFESFVMGAEGWVSVAANIAPRLNAQLFDLCNDGNYEEAKRVYEKLTPLLHLLEYGDYVQISKYALDLMGFAGGHPRQPRLPLNEKKQHLLQKIMKEIDLIS